jgi:transcriptional regulator with XRE-family HTH domain
MPSDDRREIQPAGVVGGNVGERIDAARKLRGLSKRELADALGHKDQAQVSKWISGTKDPSPGSLRKLAEVLAVTVDDLLGVAEGQEPPFTAWREFLATPEGQTMNDGERRALRAFNWPSELQPTVHGYVGLLGALRIGTRPRE